MVAEAISIAVMIVAVLTETLHSRRVKRVAPLAFGPKKRPALWALLAPWLRIAAIGLLAWGLTTLFMIKPKVYKAKTLAEDELRHVVLILDVSPSMKLKDAGPEKKLTRGERAFSLMESFFKRVSISQMRLSMVAVYNGAKPVVVDTKDVDVVRNFLDGMEMYQAFDTGNTQLFDGLEEAVKIAADWRANSTTFIVISDGDTVPAKGMPKLPRSVDGVVVVGVGDPKSGSFIDGRQSRQDVSTLRQIALRLGGEYHDGNEKHLPTELIVDLTSVENEDPFEKLSRREYALIACGIGAIILALLPVLLGIGGTTWKPGVRTPAA